MATLSGPDLLALYGVDLGDFPVDDVDSVYWQFLSGGEIEPICAIMNQGVHWDCYLVDWAELLVDLTEDLFVWCEKSIGSEAVYCQWLNLSVLGLDFGEVILKERESVWNGGYYFIFPL